MILTGHLYSFFNESRKRQEFSHRDRCPPWGSIYASKVSDAQNPLWARPLVVLIQTLPGAILGNANSHFLKELLGTIWELGCTGSIHDRYVTGSHMILVPEQWPPACLASSVPMSVLTNTAWMSKLQIS